MRIDYITITENYSVLITLDEPTSEMTKEAVTAGRYRSELWQHDYPRLHSLSVEALLKGAKISIPPAYGTFKKAVEVKKETEQKGFGF
jgi:hypothetical protein